MAGGALLAAVAATFAVVSLEPVGAVFPVVAAVAKTAATIAAAIISITLAGFDSVFGGIGGSFSGGGFNGGFFSGHLGGTLLSNRSAGTIYPLTARPVGAASNIYLSRSFDSSF